jgi:glycosyltransferase involved in cell wall biosynthesis
MSIEPLRVVFVVESGTDVRLVEGLADRCELTVVARHIPSGREISQPTSAGFHRVDGPASFIAFAWFVFRWLVRARSHTDAIVLQGYGLAALAGNLAARCINRPATMLVCSPVEAYYACRKVDPTLRRFRPLEATAISILARLNARFAQRYVVLSHYLMMVVRTHGATCPVEVVPVYGVDTALFSPARQTRAEIRGHLGLPVDPALIFFSSRIAPEKDPDTLLGALALLRREGRDVRVLHLSGGHEEFVRRARAAGLESAVIAQDAVPPFTALAEWYRAADVCVQASREEGLGFSPLEALACGVPVVAADVGGLRDTIRDGDTGWTYRPGDASSLAHALRAALDNPDEGRRRAVRGRELVLRAYDREGVFAAFLTTIDPHHRTPVLSQVEDRVAAG